jgi:hypothetical protein
MTVAIYFGELFFAIAAAIALLVISIHFDSQVVHCRQALLLRSDGMDAG